jgi:hypothetical protein
LFSDSFQPFDSAQGREPAERPLETRIENQINFSACPKIPFFMILTEHASSLYSNS